ncbi:MAG: hypothetical protein CBR30_08520 [Dictyoglomus sp. NZ13-RE01]|nr:MAG: hypothetical protein CBR30_08520 [Dictyoglomus sp. NZ13-RE01]
MKRFFLLIFLLLFLFSISFAETQDKRYAVITMIKGNVYVKRAGSEVFQKAKLNMPLYPGDRIWVQENSSATITFSDKSTLKLTANTQLDIIQLDKTDEKETSIFKLWIGKVWATVEKLLKSGDRVEIQTPTAVAGVRGTEFVIGVNEDGSTFLNTFAGVVYLAVGGIEKFINEGFKVDIKPDGTLGEIQPFNVQEYRKDIEKEIEGVKGYIEERTKAEEIPPEKMKEIQPEVKSNIVKYEGGYGTEFRDNELFMKFAFTPEINLQVIKLGLEVALLTNGKGVTLCDLGFRYGELNLPSFGLRYGTIDNFNLGYGLIANRYSTNELHAFLIRIGQQQKFGANLLLPSPYRLRLTYDLSKGLEYEYSENPLSTYGLRLFYRPLSKFEVGINAMGDFDATYTKQQLIVGADAGYFLSKDIVLYASLAQRIIHNGENLTNTDVASENGIILGLQARFLGFINGEVQLRSISDNFTFGYFDAFYEKNKQTNNLPSITPASTRINGILAGVNSKIMNIAELIILYESLQDRLPSLHGELAVRLSPRINGVLVYEQKDIPIGPFSFITENTKLFGQVQYPIASNIDVIIKILRTFDKDGNPIDYYSVDTKLYF